ncbi:hypothetical protein AKJ56_02145 [candidate division MSBL1 archaeon SCGC-AAA382N08]|uniref:Alpha-glucan phosphorylase n=1 Tax=candidate division MSBL1 archaeon SCGC-AAA382N08 TaxID=1698285 RepID=A0A133VNC2_9EURY|nr:hypothetical protein AKJ56_02145 [candidate division MSBL1 archaeon SCGC-AAA382N08]
MEIGIENDMPTYSGGLGVLAWDTVKSFAKMKVPAVGVTLLNRRGYITQRLDDKGNQTDYDSFDWDIEKFLDPLSVSTKVQIEGQDVEIKVWKREVESELGGSIPVFFLDTNISENDERFRNITDHLYLGDQRYRFFQEVVLGIGGFRTLRELGFEPEVYHMNEGHSSLLTLELLKNENMNPDSVKRQCVFTTHTPEKSGHDTFSFELVSDVLRDYISISKLREFGGTDYLNMSLLALNLSRYSNAVSRRHGVVSKEMFGGREIDSITNGVHLPRWVSEKIGKIYDKYLPNWRKDPYQLRQAHTIPKDELWKAHKEEKKNLINYVNSQTSVDMDERVFTMAFARRATPYKRADLIFWDPDKLENIAEDKDFQIIFAGKAHPQDFGGKEIIRNIFSNIKKLSDKIKMVYLEDYDIELAKILTSGVDLWLNTPEQDREACGTSGMKAACNGIPQLSTLDGWWIEGHIEDVTGWKIGPEPGNKVEKKHEASEFYEKLENVIIPKFYTKKSEWGKVMLNTIAYNASHFHTERMVGEYISNAYSSDMFQLGNASI